MALARDEGSFAASPETRFDTIYFGGGTPSLADPADLGRLIEASRTLLGARPDAWITLEANPEHVTAAACDAWRALGISALSLGVQSFDAAELRFLGREHQAADGAEAIRLALAAGFPWVSLDLIYGLPDQTEAAWQRNLETAASLGPHHLSCYQLTVHENTPFGFRAKRNELTELTEPAKASLFFLTQTSLSRLGYEAYEVSNFATSREHRSRHNIKYWDHTPYLGLGLGAHSFAWDARGARRWWNERKIKPWTAKVAAGERPLAGEEILGAAELRLEALLLGLRTVDGIDLARFRARYGLDLAAANPALVAELERQELLCRRGGWLRPTVAGLAVADGLAARFALDGPA